ncbi:hypothetical protein RRG08_045484 [Elysia crispata]|uniref:Uncharacterized protein n=1 Tax=Elysia crispata TaxID=231223 RepID=A0AAE1AE06_9GAST|nr:hypothetical protein RRG08_045484 [Elysia crispata]
MPVAITQCCHSHGLWVREWPPARSLERMTGSQASKDLENMTPAGRGLCEYAVTVPITIQPCLHAGQGCDEAEQNYKKINHTIYSHHTERLDRGHRVLRTCNPVLGRHSPSFPSSLSPSRSSFLVLGQVSTWASMKRSAEQGFTS